MGQKIYLRAITKPQDVIAWIERVCGIQCDYGADTKYLKNIFGNQVNNKDLLQQYAESLYLLYSVQGIEITNCRYFKSVDSALRFRSMCKAKKDEILNERKKESKDSKNHIHIIKSKLSINERLSQRQWM